MDLPHDWAIRGPFLEGPDAEVGGGMGRLPGHGVAWYRKKLDIPESDRGRCILLDVDGAMSHAMVWLNGSLVGGWPYGYNSWRLDLTPFAVPGGENQLAIRLDNPNHSARWYPGGGIYRNVWLVKTDPVHVGHWGTFIRTRDITASSAVIDLDVTIKNEGKSEANVEVVTRIFIYDPEHEFEPDRGTTGNAVTEFDPEEILIGAGECRKVTGSVVMENPGLWGPPPEQEPNLYVAVTTLLAGGIVADRYETTFGIRSLELDPERGILVNGQHIPVRWVNQHHDLGALGAAFNTRAAERQLELLREMGCNAIRMAHNPPAPELLELTDRLGLHGGAHSLLFGPQLLFRDHRSGGI